MWEIYSFLEEQYSRENDRISFALWSDITSSVQLFGNCAVEVSRGQPSGNPGTSIINSLYNSALLYVVLYDVLSDIGTTEAYDIRANLDNHYRALVYGDDNLLSFSKSFCDVVDPKLITQKMLQFGHKYTSDAKDTSELAYRNLSDVSILKRHFRFQNGHWCAPLELSSILEPLNWDKVEDDQIELKKIQMSDNIRTAIRELSQHSKETFEFYTARILFESKLKNIQLNVDCFKNQRLLQREIRDTNQHDYLVKHETINYAGRTIQSESPDEQSSSIDSQIEEWYNSPILRLSQELQQKSQQ